MRVTLLLLMAITLPMSAPVWVPLAWADDTASIPYAQFAKTLQVFETIPAAGRDHVIAGMAVQHDNEADHGPVHLWVIDNGIRVDLPLNAENFWFGPVRPDWVARGLVVQTDQPKHSLKIAAGVWLAVPPGRTVSLAYLREGLRQTNEVSRSVARAMLGYLAQFAVPKVSHVIVTLAGCCGGTAVLRVGGTSQTLHQDSQGNIAVPDDALSGSADGDFVASAPITKLDPT